MSADMEKLRRTVAKITGQDPETWPSHGNASLAIAATVQLLHTKVNNFWRDISQIVEQSVKVVMVEQKLRVVNDSAEVFMLHVETSDNFGTSEVLGIYSTREKANAAASSITAQRTSVEIKVMDQPQPPGGFK